MTVKIGKVEFQNIEQLNRFIGSLENQKIRMEAEAELLNAMVREFKEKLDKTLKGLDDINVALNEAKIKKGKF